MSVFLGLTDNQKKILLVLLDGEKTTTIISNIIKNSKDPNKSSQMSGISLNVKGLIGKGLVVKRKVGRECPLTLTERGKKIAEGIKSLAEDLYTFDDVDKNKNFGDYFVRKNLSRI